MHNFRVGVECCSNIKVTKNKKTTYKNGMQVVDFYVGVTGFEPVTLCL